MFGAPKYIRPIAEQHTQLALLIYSNQDHPRDYDEPVRFEDLPSTAQTSKQELEDLTDQYLMDVDLRKFEWKQNLGKKDAEARVNSKKEPGYGGYCAHVRELFPDSIDDFDDICANI